MLYGEDMILAKFSGYDFDAGKIGLPMNEIARLFCLLVDRPFLDEREIYIIRKIGIEIEVEKEDENNGN